MLCASNSRKPNSSFFYFTKTNKNHHKSLLGSSNAFYPTTTKPSIKIANTHGAYSVPGTVLSTVNVLT